MAEVIQGATKVYVIYSSDGESFSQLSLTSGSQGALIANSGEFIFKECTGYFGLLFQSTNATGNWRIDNVNITLSKKSTAPAKNLDHISVSGTPVDLSLNGEFNHEGITVMAYWDNGDPTDVTDDCSYTGYDMSTGGAQTVTVSYVYNGITKTSSYDVRVKVAPFVFSLYEKEMEEGDYLVCYKNTEGVWRAMKNEVVSNRLSYEEVKPIDDGIITDNSALIWHIAKEGDYWTIYSSALSKYVSSTGVKSQAGLSEALEDKAKWTIQLTENGTFDITNKFNSSQSVNASLRNNGNYGFACYASGSYGPLALFRFDKYYATISDAKYATLCLPFNFTVPEGVTAYTAKVNDDKTFVNITKIAEKGDVIPADMGIIISGEPGSYTFTGTTDDATVSNDNNDLVGVTKDTELTGGYILALDDDGTTIKFFQIDPDYNELGAYKAYLDYSGSANALGIRVNDATGIRTIEAQAVNQYFDLMGRKVQNPERGIYILNGKKVYVK